MTPPDGTAEQTATTLVGATPPLSMIGIVMGLNTL
jgi:hypothetical protein